LIIGEFLSVRCPAVTKCLKMISCALHPINRTSFICGSSWFIGTPGRASGSAVVAYGLGVTVQLWDLVLVTALAVLLGVAVCDSLE